ncbi:phage tail assembly chaperone [Pseudomonas sp. COR58]|uniref:Phage tail assembly chaperone n=1 Tax=Pseudomonas ekonensis TaxID=2842353 RepID=A0ABS6PHN8_9PSED|nr:phage tail assembly chaperone [Pseudomonas ekonensis]MBV4459995.1 phage tail assembly chaperone [Pseudomonas ekonensis]
MKAMIENGVVTALASGDVEGGVALPEGLPVSVGWGFADDTFSAPPASAPARDTRPDAERRWRTARLTETDWLVIRHRDELDVGAPQTLSAKQFSKLQAYRQALRDWPVADDGASRPEPPKWLARLSRPTT